MSVNVGSAYMTILPDLQGFGPRVRAQVDGSMGPSSPTARALAKHGASGGKAYGEHFARTVKGFAEGIGALFVFDKAKDFIKQSLGQAEEAQKINALTAAVIKSTGGAARVSAGHVDLLARSIQRKSAVDSEQVKSSENLLLTFRDVRNEAGKGNKIFDRGTQAAIDLGAGLAAASHGQINFRQSTTLVGKALNDPVKGLTALRRVGVAFTADQQKQIKTLVSTNHTMAAQKIILRELSKEFGGAAASQATPAERSRLAWKDLREEIGAKLLPEVEKLQIFTATKLVPAISEFIHQMETGKGPGGEFAHDLEAIYGAGKGVLNLFESLPSPVKKYGVELAIAYLVVGRFSTALSPMARSLSATVTGMRNAETRAASLKSGFQQLAGAGGMLLVYDGLNRTNKSLGTLELAAGGALSGAALGAFAGPIGAGVGAAIGGLVGATVGLDRSTQSLGQTAKVEIGPWTDYENTLQGVAAATTASTRATIYDRLQKSGLLAQTEKLGLSDRQAVNAVLGNVAARKKLGIALSNEQRFHNQHLTDNQITALYNETSAVNASRLAQLKKNAATAQGKRAVDAAQKALDRFSKTHAVATVQISGTEVAARQLASIRAVLQSLFSAKGANGLTAGPGGIDVLLGSTNTTPPSTKHHRAMGGPVSAGTMYQVNENGVELFRPDVNGTILNHEQTKKAMASVPPPPPVAQMSLAGQRLRLVVDGRDFHAYVDARADTRVNSAAQLRGEASRAFGE